jgi:hypothetical protein
MTGLLVGVPGGASDGCPVWARMESRDEPDLRLPYTKKAGNHAGL